MNINLDKIKNIISKNYFGEIYNYIMSGKTDIRAIAIVQEGFSIEDVGFSFVNAEVPFDLRQLHDDNAVKYFDFYPLINDKLKRFGLYQSLNGICYYQVVSYLYAPPVCLIKFEK
jgi:hypothetical protein